MVRRRVALPGSGGVVHWASEVSPRHGAVDEDRSRWDAADHAAMCPGHAAWRKEVSTVSWDQDLLQELRSLFAVVDPLDVDEFVQARCAYRWRPVGADLAELWYDSRVDGESCLSPRGTSASAPAVRLLSFVCRAHPEAVVEVEVEVTGRGGATVLSGQLRPERPAFVQLQSSIGESVCVAADKRGSFRADRVPAGPVRILVRYPGRTILTSWLPYVHR